MSQGERGGAFLLRCAYQTYAWGRPGKESMVAKLCSSSEPEFVIDDSTPYAELWMGTHPKGPSRLKCAGPSENATLSEYIRENPGCLGAKINDKFGGQLPFLFKRHAEMLHALKPDRYRDDNHKPEMAIALTRFEALCGFRPFEEIVRFVKDIPELREVLGETNSELLVVGNVDCAEPEIVLQQCFTALMTCDTNVIKTQLDRLVLRIQNLEKNPGGANQMLGELMLQIHSDFPGDVGCFCVYFLNYMKLEPGQAMFLRANLPHAYLYGDCLECMACSDNVVRAGLTPKFKDVDTLCQMLDYTPKPASENLFQGKPDPTEPCVQVFSPPIPDFAVDKIEVPAGVSNLPSRQSASILVVIRGNGKLTVRNIEISLACGVVVFISANEELSVSETGDLQMFRAYCGI